MALVIENLQVIFQTPEGKIPALGPVAVTLPAGSFTCLLGPSGCGKSTLVRVCAGLQPPTAGRVAWNEQLITAPSAKMGVMFQDANLMPWRTVRDNIALPLEIAGMKTSDRWQIAQNMLPMLGLSDFAFAYPGELSGGMRQRVALGRVLVQAPEVLLLDEPFGALDALTREQISLDILRLWEQQRHTVLMVTHDIQEAVLLADRVLVMSQRPGHLIADIAIGLPRPRTPEMLYTADFNGLARQIRTAIEIA
jgi:NitT/TauT family transport system ATP-binding protein